MVIGVKLHLAEMVIHIFSTEIRNSSWRYFRIKGWTYSCKCSFQRKLVLAFQSFDSVEKLANLLTLIRPRLWMESVWTASLLRMRRWQRQAIIGNLMENILS